MERDVKFEEPHMKKPKIEEPDWEEEKPDPIFNEPFIKYEVEEEYTEPPILAPEAAPKSRKFSEISRCSICLKFFALNQLKTVGIDEKLILMTGNLLRGEIKSIEEARIFMRSHNQSPLVCRVHFSVAIVEIFKVLGIKHVQDITRCSMQSINQLMLTVHSLVLNSIAKFDFLELFRLFVQHFYASVPAQVPVKGQNSRNCSLCFKYGNRETIVEFGPEIDEFLVMVGWVLLKKCGINEAKKFLTSTCPKFVCIAHFQQIASKFFGILADPFAMQKLMDVIDLLGAKMTETEFLYKFTHFKDRTGVCNSTNLVPRQCSQVARKPHYYTGGRQVCAVCFKIDDATRMDAIQSKEEKIIVLTGCLLNGTLKNSKSSVYFNPGNIRNRIHICREHAGDAVRYIYTVLKIEEINNLASCFPVDVANVMKTAEVLCSITERYFFCCFYYFVTKNTDLTTPKKMYDEYVRRYYREAVNF
ncbi:hypothetical protein L3Y34_009536 [Caenorhabditis briggsae]|uniref:Lin-15A/B-like domain-containing protein n=1 Tax=Caenorhabditis briggsae TaxID=6238 RepID=A0AAE9A5Y6_CAEBR|nr:hypothetical protein L3Y34_009536 [Caenorhabditis briggsae]